MSRANETVHPYEVVAHYYGGRQERRVPGITLREHFAAMALSGILACFKEHEKYPRTADGRAQAAVAHADALIAALAKEPRHE